MKNFAAILTLAAIVELYGNDSCPYCMRAESLLKSKKISYKKYDIFNDTKARNDLSRKTTQRTIPQIFIDGKHIGGYDDLNKLNKSGDLDVMI